MSPLPEPRKRPMQARSQQTVDVILEATARVLAERGYAGDQHQSGRGPRRASAWGRSTSTSPNKDALVIALHERHAAQMCAIIEGVLDSAHPRGLSGHIEAVVHALLAAHRLEPALHKVLEKEFPFFDAPKDQSPADNVIFSRIRTLLEAHRARIRQSDLELATWTVLQNHGSPGSCGGDRSARPVRDRRYRAIHRGLPSWAFCWRRRQAGFEASRERGKPWWDCSRSIRHPAPRAKPTATGVSSPSVYRVNANDTAAPISDSAPASTKAEAKLPVTCTM